MKEFQNSDKEKATAIKTLEGEIAEKAKLPHKKDSTEFNELPNSRREKNFLAMIIWIGILALRMNYLRRISLLIIRKQFKVVFEEGNRTLRLKYQIWQKKFLAMLKKTKSWMKLLIAGYWKTRSNHNQKLRLVSNEGSADFSIHLRLGSLFNPKEAKFDDTSLRNKEKTKSGNEKVQVSRSKECSIFDPYFE